VCVSRDAPVAPKRVHDALVKADLNLADMVGVFDQNNDGPSAWGNGITRQPFSGATDRDNRFRGHSRNISRRVSFYF